MQYSQEDWVLPFRSLRNCGKDRECSKKKMRSFQGELTLQTLKFFLGDTFLWQIATRSTVETVTPRSFSAPRSQAEINPCTPSMRYFIRSPRPSSLTITNIPRRVRTSIEFGLAFPSSADQDWEKSCAPIQCWYLPSI